jgi:DNA-binding NarL/FixJ family response regulator
VSIGVSIIEDDAYVREVLVHWLTQSPGFRYVSQYSSAESAAARLPADKPDVVLVDINLSGQSGIHCVRRLKPLMPQTQFMMLTVYGDTDHIFDALAAGATGYMLKRTPRQEVLAAIQQLHEGGSPMSSFIARKVVQSFQCPQPQRPDPAGLSPREWEVLRLLARGLVYKEIAESLGLSITTVNTHVHRIYQKLHVRTRAEAVHRFAPFPDQHPRSRQA